MNRKSKEKNEIEELEELPEVDYSQVPEEIRGAVGVTPYTVVKTAKLTWDGKQFAVRIPSEITEELGITPDNRLRFKMTKPLPGLDEEIDLEIELI